MEYEFFFETDNGMTSGIIEALSRKALIAKMKSQFPDDIGADGFVVDDDGNESPLDW